MPTIVGILTFISRIKRTADNFKARKINIFQHFGFDKRLKFQAQFGVEHEKSFITSEPDGQWNMLKLSTPPVMYAI